MRVLYGSQNPDLSYDFDDRDDVFYAARYVIDREKLAVESLSEFFESSDEIIRDAGSEPVQRDLEADSDDDEYKYRSKEVVWVTAHDNGTNPAEGDYVAYDNEASMETIYGTLAIFAIIDRSKQEPLTSP